MMSWKIRSYAELERFETFEERYDYLRLVGEVGQSTFGFDRYLNQLLYKSRRWQSVRNQVIIRDEGCDLGVIGYEIHDKIIVHHMNPITPEDIEDEKPFIFDSRFLVCTSHQTHMAIHYGDRSLLPKLPVIRRPGDTTLW
jgi:hypothetical protein